MFTDKLIVDLFIFYFYFIFFFFFFFFFGGGGGGGLIGQGTHRNFIIHHKIKCII